MLLERLVHPVLVGIHDDGGEIGGSPLLGSLLNELDQIAAIFIVPDEMNLVDDENQRTSDFDPSLQGDLFQLVKGTFDV